MKRRVLTMSAFAAVHFVACIIASLLFFSIPGKERLGIKLSDRVSGWFLTVLSFPVRNLVNFFKGYRDQWLYEPTAFLVLAGASVLWGAAINYSVAWLKANVVRHNKSFERTAR